MSVINLPIKEVYDIIAPQFNHTRFSVWGKVKTFLDALEPKSKVLEIGCGNGKNMLYRDDLIFTGIDISKTQFEICKRKNLDVHIADMTNLPFDNDTYDYQICIATYHHLDNDKDRKKALEEMYRTLKPGGKVLITVWAMEQEEHSRFNFKSTDELVPWTYKYDGNTYLRYYHIYKKGDLEKEITKLAPEFTIESIDYELGNWIIVLVKPPFF